MVGSQTAPGHCLQAGGRPQAQAQRAADPARAPEPEGTPCWKTVPLTSGFENQRLNFLSS